MYFGFCVRVLVVSLLTSGQQANALGYRSGGSSGIKPLYDYSRNHKLAFASNFESSAQPVGFLGSYGSSEGGQVDRYSPEGSVSSYGSGSLNIRKPTQNSQQPPQTNPNANGGIQNKDGMWDLVLPQNGKRFQLGIASSKGIIMLAGPRPRSEPQHPTSQPEPQQHDDQLMLTLGQHANALGYRSGGSSGINPLFAYPRNQKLALASDFESSAKSGRFLGSPRSRLSKGGKVDGYSQEGSVSSYGSGSLNIRKPTQNSQQPPQTNPYANGVIQTKAGMMDLVLPQNGKRFQLGIASSKGIIMLAGPQPTSESQPSVYLTQTGFQPKPQQGVLQTKAGMWDIGSPSSQNVQPRSSPKLQKTSLPPQLPSFQQSSYTPKPQEGVLQTKAGMWDIFSSITGVSGPNVQPGSPPPPKPQKSSFQKPSFQQPGYTPKPRKPSYLPKPQQGVLQTKAGMWDIFSPVGGIAGPNVQPGLPQKPNFLPKQPSYTPKPLQPSSQPQQQVLPTKAGMWEMFSPIGSISGPNVQRVYLPKPQMPSCQQPGYTPKPRKPSYLPKPQQGVLQTKAGMWDIFSPVGGIAGPNVQPGLPQKPNFLPKQPSYTPKPLQPSSQPQQRVLPTKAGMWEMFSPIGSISGPNVQRVYLPKPQMPSFQQPGYTSKPRKPSYLPKRQQGVLQTKAGMRDTFSPVGGVSVPNMQPGSPPMSQKPSDPPQQPSFKNPSYLPKPQQGVLQTKDGMWDTFSPVGGVSGPNVQPRSPSPPKPQQGVLQTKAGMWDTFSPVGGVSVPNMQPGSPPMSQKPSVLAQQPSFKKPSYTPKPSYLPQQGVLQTKAGMWDIFSPVGGVSGPDVQPGTPPKPQKSSYQKPSFQQPGYTPKPSYLPQQGVLQTKAGMWDTFSPVGGVSVPNMQPGSPPMSPKPSDPPQQPSFKNPSYLPKPQEGVLQTKAGMWDIFSPVGGVSGPDVKPGSQPKPQKPGYPPKPQLGVLQTKAGMWDIFSPVGGVSVPNVQPGTPPKPQKSSYQKPSFQQPGYTPKPRKPSYLPKPQQGVLQTKAGMWDTFSPVGGVSVPNMQPGSPPMSQKPSDPPQQPSFKNPSYTPKPSYLPQQGVLQTKAGMWDIFSPIAGVSAPDVQPGSQPKPQMPSFQQPGYTPKPSYLTKPQQGVLQTKAGMWEIFSPIDDVSGPNMQPSFQQPSYTPKPLQPGSQPQQGVLQTKAGMWDIFSPVGGVSGPDVKPGSQPKPQKPDYPPKPQQGVLQTKAGMWDIFSPVGGVAGPNVQPGLPQKPNFLPKQPSYTPKPLQPSSQQWVLPTKAGMWEMFSPIGSISGPNVQRVYLPKPQMPSFQQPGYMSKPRKPSSPPKPQQGVLQTKAGMWDTFSPVGGVSGPNVQPRSPSPPKPQQGVLQTKAGMWDIFSPVSGLNMQPGSPPMSQKQSIPPQQHSFKNPSYTPKPSVSGPNVQPGTPPKPQKSSYQKPSFQQPGYTPKPSYLPKTQQGVLQTKAGMWDTFSPVASVSGPNMQPGSPPKAQQPSFQQPSSLPQQVGNHIKPAMWEFFSPGPNVQPANLKVPMTVAKTTSSSVIQTPSLVPV